MNILNNFKEKNYVELIEVGIYKSMNLDNFDIDVMFQCLKKTEQNCINIRTLPNLYSLHQLFFSNLPQEKLVRYNRTLNLQWAIDIKNQLPN